MIAARRVTRPVADRRDNDALALMYGRTLRRNLEELGSQPNASVAVAHFLRTVQDTARSLFAPAFLRGKQQSLGKELAQLSPSDHLWIDRKLRENEQYLQISLGPDILGKIQRTRLQLAPPAERSRILLRSFGDRVERLYGGVIWTVQEAGYQSGVLDLQRFLRGRHSPSLLQEENKHRRDDEYFALLAALLGADAGDTELLADDEDVRVGTSYNTQGDASVCGPCDGAAGEYWAPDEAPLPGQVCYAGPGCRCYLELIIEWE